MLTNPQNVLGLCLSEDVGFRDNISSSVISNDTYRMIRPYGKLSDNEDSQQM
jgi:hypothetical protein